MKIELAVEKDIPFILEILKQRYEWFKERKIKQWTDAYYKEIHNANYLIEVMNIDKLYVVKQEDEVIGIFLLKTKDPAYWEDNEKAYYIHHFTTKLGNSGLGAEIMNFIENLAKQDEIQYLRLDCMQANTKLNKYYENHGFKNTGKGKAEPYSYKLWEKKINHTLNTKKETGQTE